MIRDLDNVRAAISVDMNVICFDLEGPLSPQDNAYEVMSLIKNGDIIFETLSRYDDFLAMEGRENYEPGDTLALIVPFLLTHGIKEADITRVSARARIVSGAKNLIARLKTSGWDVHIISTSYEQHAHQVGAALGVGPDHISCTRLDLEGLRSRLTEEDVTCIRRIEEDILNIAGDDNETMFKRLNDFYFEELKETGFGDLFSEVRVVGGARKVAALERIAASHNLSPGELVAVGDSITDFAMLGRVRDAGGVAIVFNGNEYAVPHANVAIAGTDIGLVREFAEAQARGDDAVKLARTLEPKYRDDPRVDCLTGANAEKIKAVVKAHSRFRKLVRGDAAKLG
ncbi:MAG: hypothetical protein EF813_03810 [Methanosarcinales archaeon]|nr:MAG: hypothetical protein EF813_03810 [Methanosarcinales archaeon]